MDNIKIIVAAHLDYEMPADQIYQPVFVGAALHEEKAAALKAKGYLTDNSGDNISDRNNSYSELTGLYWAWKNLDTDYLGLVHYRRHFRGFHGGRSGSAGSAGALKAVLSEQELRSLLRNYRIIVPDKRHYFIESLYSHYEHTHYAEHLKKTREILSKRCPEYLPSYDHVMRRSWGYMFNMMIMERSLVNSYCGWLFPILFELEKEIDTDGLTGYQSRYCGRVAEILFNVWLDDQIYIGKIKPREVCEQPLIYLGRIDWWRKGTSFLKAKFLHEKYESSF